MTSERSADDAGVRGNLWIVGELEPSLDDQGYSIDVEEQADLPGSELTGSRRITVQGGGRAGLMYGLLRVAEIVRDRGVDHISTESAVPAIRHRGIKLNAPLDARTPSYSDDGDSGPANIPVMWELAFWRELFDQLAAERYNMVSLWNLHPFPSMVSVPEYPLAALADVMQGTVLPVAHTTAIGMFSERIEQSMVVVRTMTIAEKVDFWRAVMQLADDRCIEVMVFTWNVFTYGTEHTDYGIDDSMDNPVTVDYLRASVRAMFATYPLLSGIGVTAGEHMDRHAAGSVNQEWLRATYGAAVNDVRAADPGRSVRLIHRTHWSELSEISRAFGDVDVAPEFSYKYSAAHLHAQTRPHYIDSDGFLEALPADARFWLTVRDDDYYLLRPGDPEFVAEYLAKIPDRDRLNGFYLGADGYVWGREFLTPDQSAGGRRLVIDRQWYLVAAFGQLAYSPALGAEYFVGRLAGRYPGIDARALYDGWRTASEIIPTVNRFHFGGNLFDLHWYPEACLSHIRQLTRGRTGFHTVHDFISCAPMPRSGMVSIPDAHAGVRDGRLPSEVAAYLDEVADRVEVAVTSLRRSTRTDWDADGRGPAGADEEARELAELLGDLVAVAELGRYYAAKIRGAIAVHALTVDPPGDVAVRAAGVAHLQEAAGHWARYAEGVHRRYRPQRLSRLGGVLADLHALSTDVAYDVTLARSAGYDEHQAVPPSPGVSAADRHSTEQQRPLPSPRSRA